MIYGYCRVSTRGQQDGNSLEVQERALREQGAAVIYSDSFTGKQMDRPELKKLIGDLHAGDTLMVTKLDRLARSMTAGSELVSNLISQGIKVHILNIGLMDDTPSSKLIRNVFFAFAEFERDMIVERTQEGKEIARQNPGFREGRPRKYTSKQMDHALSLLKKHSYNQVAELTGISKSTLLREKRKATRQ